MKMRRFFLQSNPTVIHGAGLKPLEMRGHHVSEHLLGRHLLGSVGGGVPCGKPPVQPGGALHKPGLDVAAGLHEIGQHFLVELSVF